MSFHINHDRILLRERHKGNHSVSKKNTNMYLYIIYIYVYHRCLFQEKQQRGWSQLTFSFGIFWDGVTETALGHWDYLRGRFQNVLTHWSTFVRCFSGFSSRAAGSMRKAQWRTKENCKVCKDLGFCDWSFVSLSLGVHRLTSFNHTETGGVWNGSGLASHLVPAEIRLISMATIQLYG